MMAMPLNFESLENPSPEADVKGLCAELELDERKCKRLEGFVKYLQRGAKPRPADKRRVRSKWQACIAERRAGKPFDPAAIRELAREYKAGTCPSK